MKASDNNKGFFSQCSHFHIPSSSAITCSLSTFKISHLFSLVPEDYFLTPAVTSINGSSSNAYCSKSQFRIQPDTTELACYEPKFSVLCDGIIPMLSDLDGAGWAGHLVTLRLDPSFPNPTALFTVHREISRVEVVMFNCPQWGIAIRAIQSISVIEGEEFFYETKTVTLSSCDSLVRVCLNFHDTPNDTDFVGVIMSPPPGAVWVHLAEVTFYDTGSCPPDEVLHSLPPLQPTPTPTPNTTKGTYNYGSNIFRLSQLHNYNYVVIIIIMTVILQVLAPPPAHVMMLSVRRRVPPHPPWLLFWASAFPLSS